MNEHVDVVPAEARAFQGRQAGLVTRTAAAAIDIGVVCVALASAYLAICAGMFILKPASFQAPLPPLWLSSAAGYAAMTLYLGTLWHSGGRTYGGHVMGLRVVTRRGLMLPWATAYLRALLCVAFPVGILWIAFSRARRSVQDILCHTSVLYDWSVKPVAHSVGSTRSAGTLDAEAAVPALRPPAQPVDPTS